MGWYTESIVPLLAERPLTRPELHGLRADVLRSVSGDVLEIGFGSGANLPHYPAHVHGLTAVDPSAGMARLSEYRVARWDGALHLRQQRGERMPFANESFDSVVMTLTLCSVKDMHGVLTEARRVLRPGGKVHFAEHVASTEPAARTWQNLLNWVSCALLGGCHLNRDVELAFRQAGFQFDSFERFMLPGPPWLLAPLYPAVRGVAVKPA